MLYCPFIKGTFSSNNQQKGDFNVNKYQTS